MTDSRIGDAIKEIDAELGEGFARSHPGLIGALVNAVMLAGIDEHLGDIADELDRIREAFADTIGETGGYSSKSFVRVADLNNNG